MSAASPISTAPDEVRDTGTPAWTRGRRRQLRAVRWLAPPLLRALGRTWRWELPLGVPEGAFTSPPQPAVYVFWHQCLLPIAWFARDRGFGVLISQHFDGEIIAQVAGRLGYRLFRGSSTRGGPDALQAMQDALARGKPIALTVDGPRGPAFTAKGGAIQLAKATGTPIYALDVAPQQAWRLRSWDRLQIPKPGARLRGMWAGPLRVPGDADTEQMEQLRLEMEGMLNRLREDNPVPSQGAETRKDEQ
ncbi:MAG: lysophospholipid acyltransferase family protein [Terriglobales bacterium]